MRKFLIIAIAALALVAGLAIVPAEAEARGCRGGGRGGLFHRLRDRRQERGGRFHLLQGRFGGRGGCSTCDASDGQSSPELIRSPAELAPEIRVAEADQE